MSSTGTAAADSVADSEVDGITVGSILLGFRSLFFYRNSNLRDFLDKAPFYAEKKYSGRW